MVNRKYTLFNKDLKTITIFDDQSNYKYEIDLDDCIKASEILDSIFHIHCKEWCTNAMLRDVFYSLQDACKYYFDCDIQEAICYNGSNKKINWKKK